jgi:hypothetical protein
MATTCCKENTLGFLVPEFTGTILKAIIIPWNTLRWKYDQKTSTVQPFYDAQKRKFRGGGGSWYIDSIVPQEHNVNFHFLVYCKNWMLIAWSGPPPPPTFIRNISFNSSKTKKDRGCMELWNIEYASS